MGRSGAFVGMSNFGNRAVNVVDDEGPDGSGVTSNCLDLSTPRRWPRWCLRGAVSSGPTICPLWNFGSLHVTACDRQAVRPGDMDGERSIVEAGAFAEHQPCDPYFLRKRHRPARRSDQQHARVVGIEIVAQRNLPRWNRAGAGRLFRKVQVMRQRLIRFFSSEVLVVKLRLPARQADQTRELGQRIIGKRRIPRDGLCDAFDTQRLAKDFAPLRRPGSAAEDLERAAGTVRGLS